jgi:hypothetical protein
LKAVLSIVMAQTKFNSWAIDLPVSLLLAVIAWLITRNYLGDSLFAWGDHPGQFMRFWYPLAHAIPESGHGVWGVISWNPTWYAGYPEIQFYPPGTTLLGVLLHYLTFGQLSPERVYNLIPAIAFALPLFTCYAFLRYALSPLGIIPSALGGIAAGLLAISLKPMWGGIDGVQIGLMGERLAFGFAPLVLLAGWWFVERPSWLSLTIASISLAILLLLHPFHAPALVIATGLYALARMQWRTKDSSTTLATRLRSSILWLAGWLLLSVALVAWWIIPLLTYYDPYAAALVRATTDQVISWFDAGRLEWLWFTGLMALMLMAQRHPRVEGTVGVIALLAPLLVGGILFNDQVLLARFGITMLDPIRFIAEYFLALLLLAGCAVAAVTSRFLWRIWWLAIICSVVVVVTLQPYVELAWQDLQTRIQVPHASTLDGVLEHSAFSGFWDALRSDPTSGRVYFVSNYLFLTGEDGVVTPTTVNSMTPYFLGREIIGGTFSHWSPIARWLWVGDPWAELLPAQVELSDDQVFGIPWDQISADELAAALAKLNVTTVVVEADDQHALNVIDMSPHFSRYWQNDHFALYHLATNPGDWIEAQGANASLVERSARRWVIAIDESAPNATLLLKMSHYPLWRASANGQPLPVTATAEGLQLIDLPSGGPYTLEVAYREGFAEWSGLAISLTAVLLLVVMVVRYR